MNLDKHYIQVKQDTLTEKMDHLKIRDNMHFKKYSIKQYIYLWTLRIVCSPDVNDGPETETSAYWTAMLILLSYMIFSNQKYIMCVVDPDNFGSYFLYILFVILQVNKVIVL